MKVSSTKSSHSLVAQPVMNTVLKQDLPVVAKLATLNLTYRPVKGGERMAMLNHDFRQVSQTQIESEHCSMDNADRHVVLPSSPCRRQNCSYIWLRRQGRWACWFGTVFIPSQSGLTGEMAMFLLACSSGTVRFHIG
ncbi:unnamed protein product [Protopolystoma xenopodis]|uniref:Uncharacterized protein n=1 Tax=Protopolystoma xenopodis TaxID=117903 RepID=A0A3S4ZM26_9PLAT|nr:unnamed protein product [Protopolystoma xenopodis]